MNNENNFEMETIHKERLEMKEKLKESLIEKNDTSRDEIEFLRKIDIERHSSGNEWKD